MEWNGSGRAVGRAVESSRSTPAAIFLFFNSLETREDAPVEPGAAHLPTKNSFIRPFPCGAITIAAARSSLAWLHITSPTLQLSKSPRVMSATNFTSAARKAGANLRRGRSDAIGQRVSIFVDMAHRVVGNERSDTTYQMRQKSLRNAVVWGPVWHLRATNASALRRSFALCTRSSLSI